MNDQTWRKATCSCGHVTAWATGTNNFLMACNVYQDGDTCPKCKRVYSTRWMTYETKATVEPDIVPYHWELLT